MIEDIKQSLNDLRNEFGNRWGCHWFIGAEYSGGRNRQNEEWDICFWIGTGMGDISGHGATLDEAWLDFNANLSRHRESSIRQRAGELLTISEDGENYESDFNG